MIITKIEPLNKTRFLIYIDGERSFVLYRGELRTYKIEEGSDISIDTYNIIMNDVLVKRARLRAMNLLMKHSFTVRQLRNKLSDGYYPENIIDNAIEYVSSYGYINDESYALDYIECHKTDKSINRIKQDLINKGIDKNIIMDLLNGVSVSEDTIDEEAQIRRLLVKRHFNPDNASYEEVNKTCAFLLRKGFDIGTIRRVIKSVDLYE